MTIDEFVDLMPQAVGIGRWYLTSRRQWLRLSVDSRSLCPVEAVAEFKTHLRANHMTAGVLIGMHPRDRERIEDAADNVVVHRQDVRDLRERLLRAAEVDAKGGIE